LILETLLFQYQQIFAKSSDDLGRTDLVKHKKNTGSSLPIRQPPRRQPLGKRNIEKEEIDKMLQRGVIEPSNSSWASPVVLVTKKMDQQGSGLSKIQERATQLFGPVFVLQTLC